MKVQLLPGTLKRGVAQPGSVRGSGPRGREFESHHPDLQVQWSLKNFLILFMESLFSNIRIKKIKKQLKKTSIEKDIFEGYKQAKQERGTPLSKLE